MSATKAGRTPGPWMQAAAADVRLKEAAKYMLEALKAIAEGEWDEKNPNALKSIVAMANMAIRQGGGPGMSTQHTIAATWVQDAALGAEVDVTIAYNYTPGSGDTYDASRGGPGGWDPGYPAEVEFVSATAEFGGDPSPFPDLAQARLDAWAVGWLRGDGYDEAVANAVERNQPDPDVAYDAMRDDRMTGDW